MSGWEGGKEMPWEEAKKSGFLKLSKRNPRYWLSALWVENSGYKKTFDLVSKGRNKVIKPEVWWAWETVKYKF